MNILITGATGLVGKALVQALLVDHELTLVGRNLTKLSKAFSNSCQLYTWPQLTTDIIAKQDVVVNLAGENIGAKRWSKRQKNIILQSRIKTTSLLSQLCATLGDKSPKLISASAIGIYGNAFNNLQQAAATESDEPSQAHQNYLYEVAKAWEDALLPAIAAKVTVITARFAVILDKQQGALAKLLPSFKFGLGAVLGNGQQTFAWVVIDDVIKALCFFINNKIPTGAYNIVADECVNQKQFATQLAKTLHKPCFLNMPTWVVTMLFGQMGQDLLLEGANVSNVKIKRLGFNFDYPQLDKALQHVCNKNRDN